MIVSVVKYMPRETQGGREDAGGEGGVCGDHYNHNSEGKNMKNLEYSDNTMNTDVYTMRKRKLISVARNIK